MSTETLRTVYGLSCPKCGEDHRLRIVVTCIATVFADGIDDEHDYEWDPASYCGCPGCDFNGTVADFTIAEVQS